MASWSFSVDTDWCAILAIVVVTCYITYHFILPVIYVKGLSNRYVFITGCDSGFGHQLAVRLDGMGVNVVAGCLTRDGAQKLAEKTSEKLRTVLMDVTKPEEVKKAFEFVKEILPASSGNVNTNLFKILYSWGHFIFSPHPR